MNKTIEICPHCKNSNITLKNMNGNVFRVPNNKINLDKDFFVHFCEDCDQILFQEDEKESLDSVLKICALETHKKHFDEWLQIMREQSPNKDIVTVSSMEIKGAFPDIDFDEDDNFEEINLEDNE